jgi:MFS family permease
MAPVVGVLADRYGRRAVLVPCLVGIGTFGLISALAPTFELLLLAWLLQDIGAAGLINLAVVLIGDHWTGIERTDAGEGLFIPTLQDVVASSAPASQRGGGVVAIWVGAARAGQTVGPDRRLAESGRAALHCRRLPTASPRHFPEGVAAVASPDGRAAGDRWGTDGGGPGGRTPRRRHRRRC